MGVHTDCSINPLVPPGQFHRLHRGRQVITGHQDISHTLVPGTANDLLQVIAVSTVIQVAVGIKELHRTRAPPPTGFSGTTSASSSPFVAARSIPWESRPRIFAGFRLATTTISRPIKEAGS